MSPRMILGIIWIFQGTSSCCEGQAYPFRNVSLPWSIRVDDLVSRLTLEEVIQQMAYGGGYVQTMASVPRLGILPYNFDTECLRGVVKPNKATAFPQSVGLAASFSIHKVAEMAEAIGTEARAIHSDAMARKDYSNQHGISCFAPFINVMRHPLWGRVQELYGEDPYLSSQIGMAYVKGLQGNHPRYVRASAGCKVIGLYSGPEDNPSRFSFNAVATNRDFRLTYFKPFKACIGAGTYNLMCSYYKTNGIPSCADKWIMEDVMRGEYGFKGYVVTDWGAIENMIDYHHYYKDLVEAAAAAVKAGVNLELTGRVAGLLQLLPAVKKGLISESRIRERVKPLFYTRMRLGEFDPPEMNPFSDINLTVVQSKEHRELSNLLATETFVLLKNEGGFLPLDQVLPKTALVGPMSDNLLLLYGNYYASPDPRYGKTVKQGLEMLTAHLLYTQGCDSVRCTEYNSTAVKNVISHEEPKVVFVALGTGVTIESEGNDRTTLDLPKNQTQLLMDSVKYAQGKPVVLLLFTGGPVNISWAKNEPGVTAIIQCFFPAQSTGEALRRILTITEVGVISPAGRLPYTWPASLTQVPPMVNYSMEGRTYRYFKGPGEPLYPFGYGLSYSSFKYSDLSLVKDNNNVIVSGSVTNTGKYPSDEVIQVYVSWINCTVPMPQLELVAFDRVHLRPTETLRIQFTITEEQLMIWDDDHGFVPFKGIIAVYFGGQQPNQMTVVSSNVLTGNIDLKT